MAEIRTTQIEVQIMTSGTDTSESPNSTASDLNDDLIISPTNGMTLT